jgi:hypothetical protein
MSGQSLTPERPDSAIGVRQRSALASLTVGIAGVIAGIMVASACIRAVIRP